MKTIVFLFALLAVAFARSSELYTDRYDNVDLEGILANRRLLSPYIACVLEEGKCTPEGKELKSHIREAMQTSCEKCTPAQKKMTERVISHLVRNERTAWNKLQAKYDPTGKYTKAHETELRNLGA